VPLDPIPFKYGTAPPPNLPPLGVYGRTERLCCVAILRVAAASIALTPGPSPARGRGVARSDGVRAFQRVRTQNTPWIEHMFYPPMNRWGEESDALPQRFMGGQNV
jgi:hypothetical protein